MEFDIATTNHCKVRPRETFIFSKAPLNQDVQHPTVRHSTFGLLTHCSVVFLPQNLV